MSDESADQGRQNMSSVEKMTAAGAGSEDLKKFKTGAQIQQPTSQSEAPDIRMQVSSDEEAQRAQEEEEAAQYEMSVGRFRRPEITEFGEQLQASDVREYAYNTVQVWLERYVRTGEQPNKWQIDNMAISAGGRMKQLRKIMDSPTYRFSPEEELAGLKAGVFWREPNINEQNDKTLGLKTVKKNGEDVRVWTRVVRGVEKEIGYFATDANMIDMLSNEGFQEFNVDKEKYRPRFFIGREVTEEKARENREKLANEVEKQVHHVEAWSNILAKVYEQDMMSGDLDNYVEKMFLRIGKMMARSKYYGEVFGAPESREGFAPFGEKIAVAYEAWREIAESRAHVKVQFADPNAPGGAREEVMVIPNMYAYAKNQGRRDLCMDYVKERVAQEKPLDQEKIKPTESVKTEEHDENLAAAQAGFIFMDHWDNDAVYAMDILRKEGGYLDQAIMEGSLSDKFKLVWATPRRSKEFFNTPIKIEKAREHPRAAGPPVNITALPQMTGSFLETVTLKVKAINKADGREELIPVTIDQRAYGTRDVEGNRAVYGASGKRYSEVRKSEDSSRKRKDITDKEDTWIYEVTGLTDKNMWDTVQIVLEDEKGKLKLYATDTIQKLDVRPVKKVDKKVREILEEKKMRMVEGVGMHAQEVPGNLLDWYALAIFKEYTRTDTFDQFTEYTGKVDNNILKKLSKKFQVGSSNLESQMQLSEDTVKALEEYQRIMLVAGVCASIIKHQPGEKGKKSAPIGDEPEHRPTILNAKAKVYNDIVVPMEQSIFSSRFVRTKVNWKGKYEWSEKMDEKLFQFVINNRDLGPFDPWTLKEEGMNYFTDDQLEELKPLYSFKFVD